MSDVAWVIVGTVGPLVALCLMLGVGILVGKLLGRRSADDPSTEQREAVQDAPTEPYMCLRHTDDCGHDGQMEYAAEVAYSMEAGFFWDPPGDGDGSYDHLGVDGERRRSEVEMFTAMWHAGDVPVVPGRMPTAACGAEGDKSKGSSDVRMPGEGR